MLFKTTAFDFGGADVYRTDPVPEDLVTADFNNDSTLDIAVANSDAHAGSTGNDTVSIFLGRGHGRFRAQALYTVGVRPEAIAAGHFDTDNTLDLATADFGSSTVSVLLGSGGGSFSSAGSIAVAGGPRGIVARDLSGDGKIDLATANHHASTVTILQGSGDGSFRPGQTLAVGANPEVITAGRFNDDSAVDLATANNGSNNVTVLCGGGDGTFRVFKTLPVEAKPRYVKAVDLNADGFDDLLTANTTANTVSILSNRGGAGFTLASTLSQAGRRPIYINVGDLNGDSRLDCAVSYSASDAVGLFPGLGGFAFGAPEFLNSAKTPLGIGIGHFNNDGKADLAVASANADELLVYLARSDPTSFIREDGEPGTSSTGVWSVSSAPRPSGASSLYATEAGAAYTFHVSLPQPGLYEVSLWWTQAKERRADVPVDITHERGTSTVTVDQRVNGGVWNNLGEWEFRAGATVTIRSLGNGQTSADAVCITRLNQPPEAVVDSIAPSPAPQGDSVTFTAHGMDADGNITAYRWRSSLDGPLSTLPSFSTRALSAGAHSIFFKVQDNLGSWSEEAVALLQVNAPAAGLVDIVLDAGQDGTSGVGAWRPSFSPDRYGADCRVADEPGAVYTYHAAVPKAGTYDLYLWWSDDSTRRADVPVQITHAQGTSAISVNQQVRGGQWSYAGAWRFEASAAVAICSLGTGSSCADAVRLLSVRGAQ